MKIYGVLGLLMALNLFIAPVVGAAGVLTAGDVDDNLNFSQFLGFLDGVLQGNTNGSYPDISMADRVTLRIVDARGTAVSNALVRIAPIDEQKPTIETYAGTDGVFRFFPTLDGAGDARLFTVQVTGPGAKGIANALFDLDSLPEDRTIKIVIPNYVAETPDSLDIMLVLDTTGSMSDEMRFIQDEFVSIMDVIVERHPNVDIRYSLVVYRDQGDVYVVRSYPFTSSLDEMQERLLEQRATGGGDYPEAMDEALKEAVSAKWRDGNTARLLFLVADAPPHHDRLDESIEQLIAARREGIHIIPVAGSGVGLNAELVMRVGAVLTNGRYIFLTDDSGVGNSHAEPHIPGYVVTTLDSLIVRVVSSELTGQRVEATEDEIIRKVGVVENGVIQESDDQDQQDVQEQDTTEPEPTEPEHMGNTTEDTPVEDEYNITEEGNGTYSPRGIPGYGSSPSGGSSVSYRGSSTVDSTSSSAVFFDGWDSKSIAVSEYDGGETYDFETSGLTPIVHEDTESVSAPSEGSPIFHAGEYDDASSLDAPAKSDESKSVDDLGIVPSLQLIPIAIAVVDAIAVIVVVHAVGQNRRQDLRKHLRPTNRKRSRSPTQTDHKQSIKTRRSGAGSRTSHRRP